ncbi:hypothetical protein CAOG_01808 [Capsaspora owczarzaki ATCC 30864]|uniref:MGAT4 conserved region domain-containing protein n=1 Tax=Capsaspora owczarzaki (strain ATCC 30864) TaxID=595528 RepID=A0A0D2WL45_CAPO3|nr:hypothetical protein CAOG_01808 [Capsaspora owczarzaki ATCC 30864]KJE90498.1 hypothetical protein CAOG_001808 [Capsaspora owczarzaki ATCC 30864]|eukprot:XP_004364676.1 hypothetical protein CAOG_01808 [Capsaspora owczarzaki ATCC 30864]
MQIRRRKAVVLVIVGLVATVLAYEALCTAFRRQPRGRKALPWQQQQQVRCPVCPASSTDGNTAELTADQLAARAQEQAARCAVPSLLQSLELVGTTVPPPTYYANENDIMLVAPELHAKERRRDVTFSIAIPTETYAMPAGSTLPVVRTLQRLINNLTPQEQRQTLIVVVITSPAKRAIPAVLTSVHTAFAAHMLSGLIEVVVPTPAAYPMPGTPLRKTYGATEQEVLIRSKPNVDMAIGMEYCAGRGRYFLALAESVDTSPNFFDQMATFISSTDSVEHSPPWSVLEFNLRGPSWGKLFRDTELLEAAAFFRFFYLDHPLENLLVYFMSSKTQPSRFFSPRVLFTPAPSV